MGTALSDEGGTIPLPEISGYRLVRVLGIGGMSTVYLGEQAVLGREVAIKVIRQEALADEVSRRRFENEARTIARLDHPHIVGIHEVGRSKDGLPYYAMPHLPRGHLGERLAVAPGGAMTQARTRDILEALLSALGFAHARGVIHRDVKAENVLFDESDRPLLADFGIALRRGYGTRVTTAGLAVGSTAYMAPEQARGQEVDQRADLYSLGVLAWEMLTGKLPYDARDALSMAIMHARDPLPRLPPHLRHWQRFLDHALTKSPRKRYRDAAQMRAALQRVPRREGGGQSSVAAMALTIGDGIRRLPMVAWVIALLALSGALGVALRGERSADADGFFRVAVPASSAAAGGAASPSVATALPAPVAGAANAQAVLAAQPDPMLGAAPLSAADRWITQTEQQLRQRRLLAPKDGNASDSLLAAWRTDPSHPRLPALIATLVDALGNDAAREIGAGNDAAALAAMQAAQRVADTTHAPAAPLARLRDNIEHAFAARIDHAARAFDRDAALDAVAALQAFGPGTAALATLSARARQVPQAGERIAGLPGDMLLVRHGNAAIAAARNAVSRDDYAQFASAAGRAEARCREPASLLRLVAPRGWKSPGFRQNGSDAVVCVSWRDADAYARWLSARDGRSYRLPTAAEARLLPPVAGSRALAEWRQDCAESCRKRSVGGRSWRAAQEARALDGERGYDDVGLRLVSDLGRGE